MALSDEMSNSAAEFSLALQKMAVAIDGDISKVVRNGVLRAFRNIVKRSPVDTGAYRASHGIANAEPSDNDGVVEGGKSNYKTVGGQRVKVSNNVVAPPTVDWTWQVGDGDIWLYNNVPYAQRIEEGHSQKQAPEGVYRLALAEITTFINAELAKFSSLGPAGGGE